MSNHYGTLLAVHALAPSLEHFLRALRPMQSTGCHIASQSEMARRGAVRVPVCLSELGRAPVPVPFLLSTLARPRRLLHIRCQLQVPPKTRTVTNHRLTRPLSRLRHGIEVASRPAGIARILVPSPQTFAHVAIR